MAAFDFTQTPGLTGFCHLAIDPLIAAEIEKISCSFLSRSGLEPVALLGRKILIQHEQHYSAQSVTYQALVTGVTLGVPSLGTETELLLRADGSDCDDFVPVSDIRVLAVFESIAHQM